MYIGKDAATTQNVDLGKVSDVGVSDDGNVYYLVERGEKPGTRYYFTQDDVQASNARVTVQTVHEFTDAMAKRSHLLCTLYGVDVHDTSGRRLGTIDNFVSSPAGALVVIETPEGTALLGFYHDLDLSHLSKAAVLTRQPPEDSFDQYIDRDKRDALLTKGVTCDLSRAGKKEGLLQRIRKRLRQSEEDRIIADLAEVDS
ncbi:MAG: hypothetical protein ACXV5I_06060 [Halobacteriota archaeon]